MSTLMQGKKGLIMGLANDRSIAWGISKALRDQGAELAFSYQGEALEKRVRPLAQSLGSDFLVPCDVADGASIKSLFDQLKAKWGKIDFVVHAIAWADKNELKGRYVDTSLENFKMSMHISCFSFTEVCKYAADLMPDGGSLLTLSYYGAQKYMPNYNVMGVAKAALEASVLYIANDLGPVKIRVNAISAGPINTLAASGIGDFHCILSWNELNAPLRRTVSTDDVGKAALFLLSDLGSGVAGEVLYVDAGYNTVGMVATENAAKSGELLQKYLK